MFVQRVKTDALNYPELMCLARPRHVHYFLEAAAAAPVFSTGGFTISLQMNLVGKRLNVNNVVLA